MIAASNGITRDVGAKHWAGGGNSGGFGGAGFEGSFVGSVVDGSVVAVCSSPMVDVSLSDADSEDIVELTLVGGKI